MFESWFWISCTSYGLSVLICLFVGMSSFSRHILFQIGCCDHIFDFGKALSFILRDRCCWTEIPQFVNKYYFLLMLFINFTLISSLHCSVLFGIISVKNHEDFICNFFWVGFAVFHTAEHFTGHTSSHLTFARLIIPLIKMGI
jgi:hypothetical protein